MLEKVAIKNGQSIETDNCITTIIYILSFTVTIVMYQVLLNIINLQRGIVTVRIITALVLVY
jgi:hypothetical protein